jgi:hypothetical protein
MEYEGVDWIQLAHFSMAGFCELDNETWSSIKGGEFLD